MVKKLFSVLAIVFALMVPAMAAPVGAAQLKGTYSFQVAGVKNDYGYYNGNTFVNLDNGGQCPKNTNCQQFAFEKITVGTIAFDGVSKAKFLSVAQYNNGGGGPVKGATYKIAGQIGTLTIAGPNGGTVSLSLGSYNAAGIATVIQIFIPDNQPSLGTAVLQ